MRNYLLVTRYLAKCSMLGALSAIFSMNISSFSADEMEINVHSSVESIMTVISLVKKSDDLPIIAIGQQKRKSKNIINDGNGKEYHLDENDPNTMVITTGVVLGPLNGHGKIYIFKRENDKWIQVSVSEWVS